MKRIGHLYEKIYQYENLLLAFYKAAKGKRRQACVNSFSDNLTTNIEELQHKFMTESVQLGDYHYFTIYDPKERQICAASFRERVIHHAIMNVLAPFFEQRMIYHTYACRKGKGQHKALEKAKEFAKVGTFYLKMDIRKYFNNIDHRVLLKMLSGVFKDDKLLNLLERIIKTYSTEPEKGLPIGNLTSQYYANLYLSKLDRFVKEKLRCKRYLRYMDDFLLFGDKTQVIQWRKKILNFLKNELLLESKKGGLINRVSHGVDFLGFRVFPHKLKISRSTFKRSVKKLKSMEYEFSREIIDEEKLQQKVDSVFAHLSFSEDKYRQSQIAGYSKI